MFKIILDSIRKYHLPIITVLVIIILVLAFFPSSPEEKVPQPEVINPQEFGAGEIGEIAEEAEKNGILFPSPTIFNTRGVISEVKSDRLIIQGDGTNFADKKPRSLTVIFTEKTITFEPGQKLNYKGLEGLNYLKPGMKILISGAENIRGKTEFKANTINVLKIN